MTDLWPSGAFFSSSKYSQSIEFGEVFSHLRRSPRPPCRLGSGTPPPHILTPQRLRRLDLGASVVKPPTQIPGYAYAFRVRYDVALCHTRRKCEACLTAYTDELIT